MKFIIEGKCVKAFGKAIHALSRIGDELCLHPMEKGLALRSVNSAHSAYACFVFSPLFFQHYSPATGPAQDCGIVKLVMKCCDQWYSRTTRLCTLHLTLCDITDSGNKLIYLVYGYGYESVLPLFRSLATIERNVDRCQISINIADSRVMFQFHCRHGITKTHNLTFHESEALQAVFASHLCPNVLKAQARLLCDMVMHFPVSQEEITLSVTPLRVSLRNYHEEGDDRVMKMMNTEMSLHPNEFDHFQVGVDSDITFCLKELRGLLSFAESHGLPVSVHFAAAGKPVYFSVEDMVLEARLVLATLSDPESRDPSQAAEALAPAALRYGGVADPLEGVCEVETGPSQAFPPEGELIASSQGSPLPIGAALMRQLTGPQDSGHHRAPDQGHANAVPTPGSTKIRFLLFGAFSAEQGDGSCGSLLSVLACSSDTEDNIVDDISKSPPL